MRSCVKGLDLKTASSNTQVCLTDQLCCNTPLKPLHRLHFFEVQQTSFDGGGKDLRTVLALYLNCHSQNLPWFYWGLNKCVDRRVLVNVV